jgi:uncharacterized protein
LPRIVGRVTTTIAAPPTSPRPNAPPRRAPTARAVLAIAAGLVGGAVLVAIGAGIGVPHLVKSGWSLRVVLALGVLAGGITMVVFATRRALRVTRGFGRAGVLVALLLLLVFVTYPLTLAVAATHVPRTPLDDATPADHGVAYEDVRLRTTDGVTLSGWYIGGTNRAAVVLLHGAGSTRSSTLRHALTLRAAGYGVLLFDARGHGRSGGRAMDFGWHGNEDVEAAVTFLAHRRDVDPARIAAVGLSMGGEEAIGAAAADDRIHAVVAEGATNRTQDDRGWLPHGPLGWAQRRIDRVTYAAADLMSDARPPMSLRDAVAGAAPRPVLLVTAGKVRDEATAARWVQEASPASVTVWEVPGASHTGALAAAPREWRAHVLPFLSAALHTGAPR